MCCFPQNNWTVLFCWIRIRPTRRSRWGCAEEIRNHFKNSHLLLALRDPRERKNVGWLRCGVSALVNPQVSLAHACHRGGATRLAPRDQLEPELANAANSLWFTCHAALHHLQGAFNQHHYFPACVTCFVFALVSSHTAAGDFASHDDDDELSRGLVPSPQRGRRAGVRHLSAPRHQERWQQRRSPPGRARAPDSHDRWWPSAAATQIGDRLAAPDLATLKAGGLSAEVGPSGNRCCNSSVSPFVPPNCPYLKTWPPFYWWSKVVVVSDWNGRRNVLEEVRRLGGDEALAAIQESRCLFVWVKAINLCFKGPLRNILWGRPGLNGMENTWRMHCSVTKSLKIINSSDIVLSHHWWLVDLKA